MSQSVPNTSEKFGKALVTNLVDALLYDRNDELEIMVKISALRENEVMGDVAMKIVAKLNPYDIYSIVPSTSRWHPDRTESVLTTHSWWEFKRSCQIEKRGEKFFKTNKINYFVRFYTEYFQSFDNNEEGPVIFAFNGTDHVTVDQYLRKILPDMRIAGHPVYSVFVDSDSIARWKDKKILNRVIRGFMAQGMAIVTIATTLNITAEEVGDILNMT